MIMLRILHNMFQVVICFLGHFSVHLQLLLVDLFLSVLVSFCPMKRGLVALRMHLFLVCWRLSCDDSVDTVFALFVMRSPMHLVI